MFWYPYNKDGDAGSANYSFGGRNARSAYCEKCANAYRLLDLSYGASKEEVKLKKWAFAELFSADRLRTMSEQARQLAEEQHKSINAACDQILRCRDCTRLREDLNGSESRPAPYQEKCAMPPQEESQPQPDKYSQAEQVPVLLKKTNHKINAITFVREQTGWGRKEAKDFVDSFVSEWQPAPEQAGATTEQEAFGETSPGKFSVRAVILVTVLVVGTLAGWSFYSNHKAQMEAEDQPRLYGEQHQQAEQQRERLKEEQQRQQREACAERSAARRQNSAIGGANQFPRSLH
jgi:ribosomal protein L7/L12